jgi:glycerol-3-phosphate acyltransferase PlsY
MDGRSSLPISDLLIAVMAGYLVGSVPFGLILTRLTGAGDLRSIGSGNIGATNVLRTGRKGLAAATLLLDGGKGAAAVLLIGGLVSKEAGLLAGLAAVIGHNFPIWLRFKGGKGVATSLGLLLAVAWPVGLAACATWLLVALLSRFSSLAAMLALMLAPFYAALWSDIPLVGAAALLGLLCLVRHHANIRRLLAGTEPKIGKKAPILS